MEGASSVTRDYYEANATELAELWGGHLHHGLWRPGHEHLTKAEAGAALVDLLAQASALPPDARVLDLGCGSGGACIQLCLRYPRARCVGVNFCNAQVLLAREAAALAGVSDRAQFICADACALSIDEAAGGTGGAVLHFAPGSFDSVWMLESLTQMPDRAGVLGTAARLLRPGGTIAVSDWMRCPLDTDSTGARATGLDDAEATEAARIVAVLERSLGLALDDEAGLRGLLCGAGLNAGLTAGAAVGAPAVSELPYWEDITQYCKQTWAWAWGDLLRPAFWRLAFRQLSTARAGLAIKDAIDRGLATGALRVGVLVARR